ncbi:MAG: CHAT domain-containing protein [Acidobacteriaceae bacterium]|nr:CHAT domain-containing protein [Acidobacteriaceae bacterium]
MSRRLLITLLAGALVAITCAGAQKRTGKTALAEAQALLQKTDEASHRQAADRFFEARRLLQIERKPRLEAEALQGLGDSYYLLEDYQHALSAYRDLVALTETIHDRKREAVGLRCLGDIALFSSRDYQAAGDYYEQAAALSLKAHDRKSAAQAFYKLGVVWRYRGEPLKAIAALNRARDIGVALKDRDALADVLVVLGACHDQLGHFAEAATAYQDAIAILRTKPPDPALALTLNNAGAAQLRLGHYELALTLLRESVELFHKAEMPAQEADALLNRGSVFFALGDYIAATKDAVSAAALFNQTKNVTGLRRAANNLAVIYGATKTPADALPIVEQLLPALQNAKPTPEQGRLLSNIGQLYSASGDQARALDYYAKALPLLLSARDREGQATVLNNRGTAYEKLGQPQTAILYEEAAVDIFRQLHERRAEAGTLVNLMNAWDQAGHPQIAILEGKRAVNLYQQIRADLSGISTDLKQSYVNRVEPAYRRLADVLIRQGRLPEAERALRFLKQEEYSDFTRGKAGESGSLAIRTDEAACTTDNDSRLIETGRRWGELQTKQTRTPAEEQQLEQLLQTVEQGNVRFQKCLDSLKGSGSSQVSQLDNSESLMETLAKLSAGVVAIYTVTGEQAFSVMLITPDARKGYRHVVSAEELNRKILDFRTALTERSPAVKQISQQLYDVVIGPELQKDLAAAKAETIMWSLDGNLRYVPMAALYDGQHYLVENYRMSVFTLASLTRLTTASEREWNAAAFGVTKPHANFKPLPAVQAELNGIVKQNGNDSGAVRGTVWMDDQFTADTLRRAFLRDYNVMHIATHFNFEAGSDDNSFLLLGDGSSLPLSKFTALAGVRKTMDLLTLSACNTAMGSSGEGKEIEGFGAEAQKKWARSVMASLWEVADQGTSVFMTDFYRRRETHPEFSKAETLRQTQLAMLRGEIGASKGTEVRGVALNRPASKETDLTHPYYWAPFFLMGNWL